MAPIPRSAPLVVIGHGVTSHWDRPWQTELSAALSQAGIASVLVSFAGNGASEGRFEDVTPTKEVADLGSVLDALQAWGVLALMYAGHSMGGAVGAIRAADRCPHRVARLAGGHVSRPRLHAADLRTPAVRRADAGQARLPLESHARGRRARLGSLDGIRPRRSACRGCSCTATPTNSCPCRIRSTPGLRPAAVLISSSCRASTTGSPGRSQPSARPSCPGWCDTLPDASEPAPARIVVSRSSACATISA